MRHHPISPITERMQYRAIGIARGRYMPTEKEELTNGFIYTRDGAKIPSVTLGKLLNLIRNHIQLKKLYLWIVYPRCREISQLHLQMVGVWEPKTSKNLKLIEGTNVDASMLPEQENYFSVRGELIYTEPKKNVLVIQIRQIPRGSKPFLPPFRLQVQGKVPTILLNHFLALDLRRQNQSLILERYVVIGSLAKFCL
uniref:Uncharacterized protein n=1 Tax=Paulinella micropora TaxID=1928728 RepID=A0A385HZ98_9EUKA|nr:hypothetical protein PMNZ_015 [Paulinella micropora]AXY62981.1 hypothetical protein PMNZ_015 [Paulinella micropora]